MTEKKTVRLITTESAARKLGITQTKLGVWSLQTKGFKEKGLAFTPLPKSIKIGGDFLWPQAALTVWIKTNLNALHRLGHLDAKGKPLDKELMKPKGLKKPKEPTSRSAPKEAPVRTLAVFSAICPADLYFDVAGGQLRDIRVSGMDEKSAIDAAKLLLKDFKVATLKDYPSEVIERFNEVFSAFFTNKSKLVCLVESARKNGGYVYLLASGIKFKLEIIRDPLDF